MESPRKTFAAADEVKILRLRLVEKVSVSAIRFHERTVKGGSAWT